MRNDCSMNVSTRRLCSAGSQLFVVMGEPRAVEDVLGRNGWDEVALAGLADLPLESVVDILRPILGDLSFGEELELTRLIKGSEFRQQLDNWRFARSAAVDTPSQNRYGSEAETPMAPLMEWKEVLRKASVTRWPAGFRRNLAETEDPVSKGHFGAKGTGKGCPQVGQHARALWPLVTGHRGGSARGRLSPAKVCYGPKVGYLASTREELGQDASVLPRDFW